MNNRFVISLSAVTDQKISYKYFKERADALFNNTLEEWVADPLNIIEMKMPELKDYEFYFNKLHNFRKRMSESLKKSHIYESTLQDDGNIKYMLIFDIDSIMQDLYKEASQYNSNKMKDVTLIVTELMVKFKAKNYMDNINFLFSNDCAKLPEEMTSWNEIVRSIKSETFYIVDEDD